MISHSAFARVLAALIAGLMGILGGVALTACGGDSFQGEIPPCRCEAGGCTAAACPIQIRLDQSCNDQFDLAEVMVDGHVEAQAVTPAAALTTCSKIEPGETAAIVVRGGDWVWPLTEHCTTPGQTRALVLQCLEVPN